MTQCEMPTYTLKAEIKFDLKRLEYQFDLLIKEYSIWGRKSIELIDISQLLAHQYQNWAILINSDTQANMCLFSEPVAHSQDYYFLILNIRQALGLQPSLARELELATQLSALYHKIPGSIGLCLTEEGYELESNLDIDLNEVMIQEKLHDLSAAYKVWFNPNRFIDVVMGLWHGIIKYPGDREHNQQILEKELLHVLPVLSSIECLDLYNCLVGDETYKLIYVLNAAIAGEPIGDFSMLNALERKTLKKILYAITGFIDILFLELKHRHILVKPYLYNHKPIEIDDTDFYANILSRIISIYGKNSAQ